MSNSEDQYNIGQRSACQESEHHATCRGFDSHAVRARWNSPLLADRPCPSRNPVMRQDLQRTLICSSEASLGCSARSEGGKPSACHGSRTHDYRLGAPWLGSTPIARSNPSPLSPIPPTNPIHLDTERCRPVDGALCTYLYPASDSASSLGGRGQSSGGRTHSDIRLIA